MRFALRSLGVVLAAPASSASVAGGVEALSPMERGDSEPLGSQSSDCKRQLSRRQLGQPSATCMIVGEHGRCPWVTSSSVVDGGGVHDGQESSQDSSRTDGLVTPGTGDMMNMSHSSASREECTSTDGNVWTILRAEACAELVTPLWIKACDDIAEIRRPGGCQVVFCPQPWPITRFPNFLSPMQKTLPSSSSSLKESKSEQNDDKGISASMMVDCSGREDEQLENAMLGRGTADAFTTEERRQGRRQPSESKKKFAVAVTGFLGAERAGWELLIERMGATLCKNLRRRVTTHLVCKEVSASFGHTDDGRCFTGKNA